MASPPKRLRSGLPLRAAVRPLQRDPPSLVRSSRPRAADAADTEAPSAFQLTGPPTSQRGILRDVTGAIGGGSVSAMANKKALTAKEAAAILGLAPATLYTPGWRQRHG